MVAVCCVGDLLVDVVVRLERDPQRGTDTPAAISFRQGGSAANVARAVVASGGEARFVGQVGNDAHGRLLIDELHEAGVEVHAATNGITGTAVVLVDPTGERSFLTDRAAALHLSSVRTEVLDGIDVLHVPAYSLVAGALAETTQMLIGEAVDRSISITVSTSSTAVLADYGRSQFMELLRAIQPEVIIANSDEARFLLEGRPWFRQASATVVTAGPGVARFTQPDGTDVRVQPEPFEPSDTTGAGDAFTGGFIVSYQETGDPTESLTAGHRRARHTLTESSRLLPTEFTP